jgi:hypothetical protein
MFKTVFVFTLFSFLLMGFASKKDANTRESQFKKVVKSAEPTDPILSKVKEKYKFYDTKALERALRFYRENLNGLKKDGLCLSDDNKKNRVKIRNTNCLVVADYTKTKLEKRLLVVNPSTGESELFYTAHGKGSNEPSKRETGLKAIRFSNKSGSNMTSLGFYLTDHLYNSQKDTFGPGPKNGLKLDGLNCSNNLARKRYIVMHTARYVPPKDSLKPEVGNSEGCVTLPKDRKDILQKCVDGALVYAHSDLVSGNNESNL